MNHSILDELLHHIHERRYIALDPIMESTLKTNQEHTFQDNQKEHTFYIKIGTTFRCRDEELSYMKDSAAKEIRRFIYKYLYDDIEKLTNFVFSSGDRDMIQVIKNIREKIL